MTRPRITPEQEVFVLTKERLRRLRLDGPPDDCALAREEEEIKGLVEKWPETGWTLLGMLAAARRDVPAMLDSHLKAVRLSGGSLFSIVNYIASMAWLMMFKPALDLAEKTLSRTGPNPALTGQAVELALLGGRFGRALSLGPGHPASRAAREAAERITLSGLSENDVSALIESGWDPLRERGLGFRRYNYFFPNDPKGPAIGLQIVLARPEPDPGLAAELEQDRLRRSPHGLALDFLGVEYLDPGRAPFLEHSEHPSGAAAPGAPVRQ